MKRRRHPSTWTKGPRLSRPADRGEESGIDNEIAEKITLHRGGNVVWRVKQRDHVPYGWKCASLSKPQKKTKNVELRRVLNKPRRRADTAPGKKDKRNPCRSAEAFKHDVTCHLRQQVTEVKQTDPFAVFLVGQV